MLAGPHSYVTLEHFTNRHFKKNNQFWVIWFSWITNTNEFNSNQAFYMAMAGDKLASPNGLDLALLLHDNGESLL